MPPQKTVSFGPVAKAEPSIFELALDEYIKRKGKKSKTPQFIADLQKSQKLPSKEDVNNAMKQLEKESTDATATRRVRNILRPVVRVLNDYSAVVDTLCNADPMPTAIIWGCMKVAIDTSKRYLKLYDDIKSQLDEITLHLDLLTEFNELFGQSKTMRVLLQMSYIDIIRFWVRVDKECHRCIPNRMGRAFASFSTSKLDGIIKDIETNANRVSRLVPAVQERLQKGEREDAAEERRLAGISREQQNSFIEQQREEMKLKMKSERQKDVRKWLRGRASLDSNFRHQEQYLKRHSPQTCSWLSKEQAFVDWIDPDTKSPMLWLKAAPGVGKSVLCAYTIDELSKNNASAYCAYQYYTFDEVFSSLQVYLSVAEQLVNRVWTHLEDIPPDIHAFTQHTATAALTQDVKTIIRMLLNQLPATYLFLDGLDEECDATGPRWEAMSEVLQFFTEIAAENSCSLHLWCSSQDRTDLQPQMEKFSVIEISKDRNSSDIESYLSKSIMKLDKLDLDEGYQNLILQDLREKADGCFLWASLMLDSVSTAKTLSAVQTQVTEGLPKNYEKYYQKKIEGIEESQRIFVSKLLACIVYARRPLFLNELCESIAVLETPDCENVDRSHRLFKNAVLSLCEPLVQIEDVDGPHGTVSTCTLTHASVRTFLLKNPQILSTPEAPAACTEEVMANVCLKYLWQPRYQRLLSRFEDTFKDYKGEDVMEHHLLSYAAKYWDKHLDSLTYTEELCARVKGFIYSAQFYTCLQIQSLFIGGQFQFWLDANRQWAGPHIKRVFPAWLQGHCDKELVTRYTNFVGEWGHVLDQVTKFTGKYPGEIDRCFWGSLGPENFLNKGPSRYKNFAFQEPEQRERFKSPRRIYDGIDSLGQNLVVLKLENLETSSEELEFSCQQWSLGNRRPKLRRTQKLTVPRSDFSLYDHPTAIKTLGRPVPVSLTNDLQYLRVGSHIFTKKNDEYIPIKRSDEDGIYFEDIVNAGPYIALASRRTVSHEDLAKDPQRDVSEEISDYGAYLAGLIQKITEAQDQSMKSSTAPTTQAESQSSPSDVSSSNTSVSSLIIEDEDDVKLSKFQDLTAETVEEFDDLEMSDASSDENSAESDWSEGSTVAESESLDDNDQWNDWGNERLAIDDLNEDAGDFEHPDADFDDDGAEVSEGNVSDEFEESEEEAETPFATEEEIEMLISGVPGYVLKRALVKAEEDAESVESQYSQSYYSDSEDSQEEASYIDNEDAYQLENLILGKSGAKGDNTSRVSMRIFNTTTGDSSPIFHFSQRVTGAVFHSPPAFHPTKHLLVWTLGNGSILFADFENNTYFTRELCCTSFKSCHIFIKPHFSPCGEFIHFAALEGQPAEDTTKMLLSLQVSTHRLSARKTARTPPKLVFKTTVPLGENSSMSVSRLPYTLTWTEKELYLVTRGTQLDVIQIPLFKPCEGATVTPICYTQNPIYLPRSAESRNVYYFPPSARKSSEKPEKDEMGKILIGSHSSIPSQYLIVPMQHMVQPPIGVLVKEETDLGGWQCKMVEESNKKDRINLEGGRLQGKFESFDTKEDCDIIPYLF